MSALTKFIVENITVAKAPLLKDYYWDCLAIDSLNDKLNSDEPNVEHSMRIPARQINSKPLKTIFWLRNRSSDEIVLRLKRVKNCDCVPMQTRVGFNQFRQLYHCPHRRLIHIIQEVIRMQPDDLVALSIVTYFFLYGEHRLTFEMRFERENVTRSTDRLFLPILSSCNNERIVELNFFLDIIGFDPQKCIITSKLIPADVREFRRFVQPIWVRNITMQQINFLYASRERGLKLINPNLTIPRQSVWPLMVEYRPSDYENQLNLMMNIEGMRTIFSLEAQGVQDEKYTEPNVPIEDYECADFAYVLYPNKLEFDVELMEERSLMVSLHNYNQKCLEFRWQSYVISDLFEIKFEPNVFRLKPHHSKLCVVNLRVFERPLHFRKIPTVLEVHRIFDKSTKIAKELLEEIESIDDPKWKEDSYLEHVFLNVNIKVNFKKLEPVEFKWEPPLPKNKAIGFKTSTTTIFEKLFWEYLSKSNFMRENKKPEISDQLNYDEVLQLMLQPPEPIKPPSVTKNEVLRILNQLTAEACRDLSTDWRFIPQDLFETSS